MTDIREAKAEALREFADKWQQGGWAEDLPPRGADRLQILLYVAQSVTELLRGEADRIEQGGTDEEL